MTDNERLKLAIEESGMSVRAIALEADIPKSNLHRYVNGETENIPIGAIKRIASICKVSPAWLLGLSNDKNSNDENIKIKTTVEAVDPEREEVIETYDSLDEDSQKMLLNYIRTIQRKKMVQKQGNINNLVINKKQPVSPRAIMPARVNRNRMGRNAGRRKVMSPSQLTTKRMGMHSLASEYKGSIKK